MKILTVKILTVRSSGGSSSEDTMGSSSYEDAVIYGHGVDLSGMSTYSRCQCLNP